MAELLRLEGRIDAHRGRADEACQAFTEAVAVARLQGAGPLFAASHSRNLAQLMAKTGERHRSARPSGCRQLRLLSSIVMEQNSKKACALLSALERDENDTPP